LDSNSFKKDNVVLKGLPRRLSGPEIADMLDNLVRDENGDQFVGYGKKHNCTHKCGLWELPYVKALILMHNLDVMHQEHNVGESILSTCMSFMDKTKDNHKARRDLAQICNRPTLELNERGGKPRAPFCLKPKERKEVMSWMQDLKFPDGYATGFRRAVNMEGVRQEDSEGGGRRTQRVWGEGGRRMRTQMVRGRSSTRTWRVWTRSTTVASRTTREGSVTGLLQARPPDATGSGGAMWSPLL
jgi:hypothetical protein